MHSLLPLCLSRSLSQNVKHIPGNSLCIKKLAFTGLLSDDKYALFNLTAKSSKHRLSNTLKESDMSSNGTIRNTEQRVFIVRLWDMIGDVLSVRVMCV